MKSKMYIVFFLLLLVFVNLYIYKQNENIDNMNFSIDNLIQKNIDEKLKNEAYENNNLYEFEYNGFLLNDNFLLSDNEGVTKRLIDVIHSDILVLRFSSLNCNTCIDEQIEILNNYVDSIGVSNIVLFTSYQNYVYMNKFRRVNKIEFPIFNLESDFDLKIKDIGVPYFFVIEKQTMRINSFFIPQKGNVNMAKKYLSKIYMNYFR